LKNRLRIKRTRVLKRNTVMLGRYCVGKKNNTIKRFSYNLIAKVGERSVASLYE